VASPNFTNSCGVITFVDGPTVPSIFNLETKSVGSVPEHPIFQTVPGFFVLPIASLMSTIDDAFACGPHHK